MIEVCRKICTHVKVNLSSVHGIKAVDMLYCCLLGDSVFGKGDKLSTESKYINGKLAFSHTTNHRGCSTVAESGWLGGCDYKVRTPIFAHQQSMVRFMDSRVKRRRSFCLDAVGSHIRPKSH